MLDHVPNVFADCGMQDARLDATMRTTSTEACSRVLYSTIFYYIILHYPIITPKMYPIVPI